MEFLLGGLILVFLVLSGPIAFIWCCVLSARIGRLEGEKLLMEQMLRHGKPRPPVPTEEGSKERTYRPQEPPSPYVTETARAAREKTENILEVWKRNEFRKEDEPADVPQPAPPTPIFEQEDSSAIADPAARTAAQWAQAVPRSSSSRPKTEEPAPPSTEHLQTDEEWEKTHAIPPPKEGDFSWQTVELWIGRHLLGWIAVGAFILAATFFIRYAVVEGWIARIPASLKVLGIAAFGGAFLVVGKYFSLRGWRRFSTMLSSAGIIIVFQAGYASYAFYELISLSAAGVVMSLIVFGAFLLAWHYESKLLGVISILGGLAVPMLLSTEVDRYPQFFTYLVILNLGVVMLVNLLNRAPLGLLAFLGTQAEFWLWHGSHYVHPDKLGAVLLFQGAVYLVYLLDTTVASMIPHRKASTALPSWDDAVRAILSPIVFFGTIWLLVRNDPTFGDWLGVVAFIGAAWYALLAVLYGRHIRRLWDVTADQKLSVYWKAGPTAATVMSLAFVAIAVPLQFDAAWIALGWTAVFAGLRYFGHRQENKAFITLSYVFFGLGFVRVMHDVFQLRIFKGELPWPVLNDYALPSLAVAVIVIAAASLTARLSRIKSDENRSMLNLVAGLVGFFVLTATLSVESARYFNLRSDLFVPSNHWASLSLTVLWGILALILLETGVMFRSLHLRNTAFFCFCIVAVKMFAVDLIGRWQNDFSLVNPYSVGLIFIDLLFFGVAIQSRIDRHFAEEERPGWGAIGLIAVFSLWAVLSIECYDYFLAHPIVTEPAGEKTVRLVALGMLSVLWTIYGVVWFVLGLTFRSFALRNGAIVVFCAALMKILALEVLYRPDYAVAFGNPYFLTILCPTLAVMATAVWTVWFRPLEKTEERDCHRALGLGGLLFLWLILSVECFAHFDRNPLSLAWGDETTCRFVASAALSMLWAALAATIIAIGLSSRSVYLRGFGLLVLGVTVLKIIGFEMFRRPAFEIPLLNPYFLSIFVPAALMIAAAVWTTRFRPLDDPKEKRGFLAFGLIGIALIWGSLSIECFQYFNIRTDWPDHRFLASMSLTVFWTLLAVVLALIAGTNRSKALRILAAGLLMLTALKVLSLDLLDRPDYVTPFLNPYALPPMLLAFATIFACVGLISRLEEDDTMEREAYRIMTFAGVVFLWLAMSLECFKAVRLLQDAAEEAWKAQMALSILWSTFGGILIFIGFVWRSSVLRWMAILLFALTSTKVLIVDMAGVHELYRFGAFFVLAVFLMFAAWAYQRFKPETPR